MKNLTFWKVAVIVLIILNIASLSYIGLRQCSEKSCCKKNSCEASHKKHHKKDKGSWFSSRLDLTETQEKTFTEMRTSHHEKVKGLKKEMHELKASQFELLKSTPESEKIDSLSKEIGALYQQKVIFTMNHFREMRALLNEDQLDNYNDLMDRIQKRIKSRKHHGHKKCRK